MRKNYTLFAALLFAASALQAQNIITVTTNSNDGEGSLRQAIAEAESGDKVVIPSDYVITLESEIALDDKHLTIDGQGATIQTAEPGVSTHRLFNLVSNGSELRNLTFENLTLLGGDVSAYADDAAELQEKPTGGVILLNKRINLTMKNCIVKNGKARLGGGVHVVANEATAGNQFLLEDCLFEDNTATAGGVGGILITGENAVVCNCSFVNNTSASSTSALSFNSLGGAAEPTAVLSGCSFINNRSEGSGDSSASVYFKGAAYTLNVDNCAFLNNSGNGSIFFTASSTKIAFTNSTFYNNNLGEGKGRGIVYSKKAAAKELVFVHCTFAGNTSVRDGSHGACITTTANGSNHTATTFVNNLFAYNYAQNGLYDTHMSTATQGTNNILNGNRVNDGSIANLIEYTDETALFAEYTTNADGNKIPVLDEATGTVPLAEGSVAIAAGAAGYEGAAIPTVDQRGETRAATPCLGAYEYVDKGTTSLNAVEANHLHCWSENGELVILSKTAHEARLFCIDGRAAAAIQLNEGYNSLSGLAKGCYILNNQKVIVK